MLALLLLANTATTVWVVLPETRRAAAEARSAREGEGGRRREALERELRIEALQRARLLREAESYRLARRLGDALGKAREEDGGD